MCQFLGLLQSGHKSRRAKFHIEHERIKTFRQLLGENRSDNQRNARNGSRHVAQPVKDLIGGHHSLRLSTNHAADILHDFDDSLGWQSRLEAWNRIQFIERAPGDPKAAPGNHRHPKTQTGQQRRQRQRNFIAHAARGMLIDQWPRVLRETQHVARVAHGYCEGAGFCGVKAAEIDSHEKRSQLVIGDLAGRTAPDDFFDLCGREGFSVALGFDERQEVHRRGM